MSNDEDQYEEGEEIEESSSSSSVYNSYGLIKEEFLENIDIDKNTIQLKLTGLDLEGGLLMQFTKPVISIICTKCLKMMPLTLSPEAVKSERGNYVETNILTGTDTCQNCQCAVELHLSSQVFNQFTEGVCLYVIKHKNCLPVNIGYFSECQMLIQCAGCNCLGLQQGLKEYGVGNKFSCRCPMCFKRISFSFNDSYFLLPNGEQLPLPKGIKKQQEKKVVQTRYGPLPHQGTCQHAKRSFRWFKFACGGVYPCDTCHEKACSCGDKIARQMICGWCGRLQSVSDYCAHCHQCVIAKKTAHWEGGKGSRNAAVMSKKDNKKYTGMWKVKSNKMKKRLA